jgi:dephospho-CoA kinase
MLICITGGIASGKSTVSEIIKKEGLPVIDTDEVYHSIVKKGGSVYNKIVEYFGKEILAKNGEIDRRKLGSIVFSSSEKRKKLNHLTHPEIIKKTFEEVNKLIEKGEKVIFVVIPLLFEAGDPSFFKQIWVVYCSEETQIKRLKKRDNLTDEDAKQRIKSQIPLKEKIKKADVVISSDKSLKDMEEDVKKQIKQLNKEN